MNVRNNKALVSAVLSDHSRPKTETFNTLLDIVDESDMAEIMWAYWGESSLKALDDPAPALNPDRRWWKPFAEKNTIRSLLMTHSGRGQIWQMLHDAAAWLL